MIVQNKIGEVLPLFRKSEGKRKIRLLIEPIPDIRSGRKRVMLRKTRPARNSNEFE